MKTILGLILTLAMLNAGAQGSDSWTIIQNNKVLGKGTAGNEDAVVRLQSAAVAKWSGPGFVVQYTQADGGAGWNRTLEFTDQSDNALQTVQLPNASGRATFPIAFIKKHASTKTPLYLYTTSLPKDKKKAAVVRVRRILLCKVEWM